MIRRGLTHDKLVDKSGAKSVEDVVKYIAGLGVTPTESDLEDLAKFFADKAPKTEVPAEAAPEKKTRARKRQAQDV
jgi:hypothetical protein